MDPLTQRLIAYPQSRQDDPQDPNPIRTLRRSIAGFCEAPRPTVDPFTSQQYERAGTDLLSLIEEMNFPARRGEDPLSDEYLDAFAFMQARWEGEIAEYGVADPTREVLRSYRNLNLRLIHSGIEQNTKVFQHFAFFSSGDERAVHLRSKWLFDVGGALIALLSFFRNQATDHEYLAAYLKQRDYCRGLLRRLPSNEAVYEWQADEDERLEERLNAGLLAVHRKTLPGGGR